MNRLLIVFVLIALSALSDAQPVVKLNVTDNFELSPYTGYTRAHWIAITEQIIAGALSYVDPQTGIFNLPKTEGGFLKFQDTPSEAQIRIMERIMTGVLIYAAATGKDEVPGYKGSISKPFLQAIIRGTDPASDGYWGDPKRYDQIGATFAWSAYLCPGRFWDPLTDPQKKNLLTYLRKQSFNVAYDNNHYFFHMVSATLLEKNNFDTDRAHHTRMFERLMGWYRGDGWYIDGGNRGFDNYNMWGFHLFAQILYCYDTAWREQFGQEIQQATARFLETFPYFFGRDGGMIPWGRSLSYRFAALAPIAWDVINDNNSLPPGMARRIASGNLKNFWDNGCMGENRLLNMGFRAMNLSVPENYLVPGDPYFALHGLAFLLIPEDHPFWTAREEAMPADVAGGKTTVTGAGMALRVSPVDGDARMYPVGQPIDRTVWQTPVKYCQHAYSSTLGFCVTGEGGDDNGAGRTGYSYDGNQWLYRYHPQPLLIEPDHIASIYKLKTAKDTDQTPDFRRDELITHTLIGNDGELHVFWHNYPDPLYLSLGGYGISIPKAGDMKTTENNGGVLITGGDYYSILQPVDAPAGKTAAILLQPREGWVDTHLFGGLGAYPSWQSDAGVPPHTPVVVYVNGTKKRIPTQGLIKVENHSGRLRILFEGKEYDIKVIGR